MSVFYCIYSSNRFTLYLDCSFNVHFLYWHELKKHGVRSLDSGTYFSAAFLDARTSTNQRGRLIKDIKPNVEKEQNFLLDNYTQLISGGTFNDQLEFLHLAQSSKRVIFIDCIFDSIEIDGELFKNSIILINCEFKSHFRLIGCSIERNFWMPNCRFHKHFSLKNTTIEGDVHMESCDFSGLGGASFRGLNARNLYLDLAVNGGDDLFWLNEMSILGTVSIGGNFLNEVQFLSHQDTEVKTNYIPSIGSIYIGKELYEYESANKTNINSQLIIQNYRITDTLFIEGLHCEKIIIDGVKTNKISLQNVSVDSDISLTRNDVSNSIKSETGITLQNCNIGRHLKIEDNYFELSFDLYGSAVSEVTYFQDNKTNNEGKLNLTKFTSSRFLVSPERFLLANSSASIFKPKRFDRLLAFNNEELGNQYCALKHWFSDAGKLEMEDIAFFHMRHYFHEKKLTRIIFGGVFGWGVRLQNIGISSAILITIFAIIYSLLDNKLSLIKAFALSTQSFISSFFGKLTTYQPSNLITGIVTLESIIGILFITVFIGAYIRKLLR